MLLGLSSPELGFSSFIYFSVKVLNIACGHTALTDYDSQWRTKKVSVRVCYGDQGERACLPVGLRGMRISYGGDVYHASASVLSAFTFVAPALSNLEITSKLPLCEALWMDGWIECHYP